MNGEQSIYHFPFTIFHLPIGQPAIHEKWKMRNDKWKMENENDLDQA